MQPPTDPRPGCPPFPGSRVTVYSRTLHRACELLGGLEALSRQLRVPPEKLVRWIDGCEDPPLKVFLDAVDIVLLGAEPGSGKA